MIKQAKQNIINIIKSKERAKIKKLVIDLILLILLIIVIKLPVILIRDYFVDFLTALNNYSQKMLNYYFIAWNIVYVIIVIIVIIKYLVKKYGSEK